MEFRPMRRHRQELSPEACREVLERATSGVLALAGDEGYPYAVPLSYALDGDRIIFHSAREGHKIDAIARCPKASFCVVDQDDVHPAEFTTYYRSVIAFGRMRVIEDDVERRAAAELLGRRYGPNLPDTACEEEINRFWSGLCMLELRIDHLSGKQARELMPPRAKINAFA